VSAGTSSARLATSARLPTGREAILLNTMPKSGSVYLAKSLANILGLGTMYLGDPHGDQIDILAAHTFSRGGFVSQNHLIPSRENLRILQYLNLKMVLHLRDPRQALLSWVHYLPYITGGNDEHEILLKMSPRPPLNCLKLSLSRQIDWHIKNTLPPRVFWATRWVEIADRGTMPILITQQNDLRIEEKVLFDKVLEFYDIDFDYALPSLARTMNETHFRLADPTEWNRTVTPEQAIRATSMIPKSLRIRFGWD